MSAALRPGPAGETTFDLADQDLAVGDVFRWPCGSGSRLWRITEVVNPEVDDVLQRVRAVPAMTLVHSGPGRREGAS